MIQTQKVPPVFETNVTSNITIAADQEAFFADATTPTHPPIGEFRLTGDDGVNENTIRLVTKIYKMVRFATNSATMKPTTV